jgi:hypothetical protein
MRLDELAALQRKHAAALSVPTFKLDGQPSERVAQGSPHKGRTIRPEQFDSHVSRANEVLIKSKVNRPQSSLQYKIWVPGLY